MTEAPTYKALERKEKKTKFLGSSLPHARHGELADCSGFFAMTVCYGEFHRTQAMWRAKGRASKMLQSGPRVSRQLAATCSPRRASRLLWLLRHDCLLRRVPQNPSHVESKGKSK
ncbi:uncharacterized protein G2W53_033771 [Senna tora]|uniref:Uncharacterized protein n=1 Tax=Senna tora TaxID=362788 RepID=A0A834W7A3_9FABA|nr:uncharacterized protein G2W53_033771 [Senna tora]